MTQGSVSLSSRNPIPGLAGEYAPVRQALAALRFP
jgi:hypothetical protein